MTIHSITQRFRVTRQGRVVLAVMLLVAVGCASSGSADSTEAATGPEAATLEASASGTVVVSGSGCSVDGIGSTLSAGPVELTIVNETDGLVVANMTKILEGGTYEQLAAHVRKEIQRAEAGKVGLGHPAYAPPSFDLFVDPGESNALRGEVTAGTYAIVCGREFEEVGEVRPSAVFGPYEVE